MIDAPLDSGRSSNIEENGDQNESKAKRCRYILTTFESINDDCLREICNYLTILEVQELASTCTRLYDFANDTIFPKIASIVSVTFIHRRFWSIVCGKAVKCLVFEFEKPMKSHFKRSGNILTFNVLDSHLSLRTFEKLLELCPNLVGLSIDGSESNEVHFNREHARILMNHVTSGLKELNLDFSLAKFGEFRRFSTFDPITLKIGFSVRISDDFFEYISSLTGLALEYDRFPKKKVLEIIFNRNGQSIRQLILKGYTKSPYYKSIGTMIVDKLLKLEHLTIENKMSVKLSNWLTELPNLKNLRVHCNWNGENVNSFFRKLCDIGTIEDLYIENGVLDDEDDWPLVFNHLRCVHWDSVFHQDSSVLFKALTTSQMPGITCFKFDLTGLETSSLLALFESKVTLNSMTIRAYNGNNKDRIMLALGIIEILKRNRNRPYLNLKIYWLVIDNELVSKIYLSILVLQFHLNLFAGQSAARQSTSAEFEMVTSQKRPCRIKIL